LNNYNKIMKDYLSQYGHAEVSTPVRSFQAGGGAPAPAAPAPEGGAPAPAGPAGPEAGGGDLQAELMQVVETQDPQLALAFCNKLGEQMAASQGAPAGPEGAPAGPPAGPPPGPEGMAGGQMPQPARYKKGGKLGVFSKNGENVSFSRK
jgi:hypothetical protein